MEEDLLSRALVLLEIKEQQQKRCLSKEVAKIWRLDDSSHVGRDKQQL